MLLKKKFMFFRCLVSVFISGFQKISEEYPLTNFTLLILGIYFL